MIYPSNFDEEIVQIRESIRQRLNIAMQVVLKEEVEKLLGRVKIMVTSDLKGEWQWYIEPSKNDNGKT